MTVNIKRNDMLTLWNLLNKITKAGVDSGRIFKIFVAKNLLVLKPEIQLIEENFKAPEAALAYDEEKRNLLIANADKDSNGAVIFNKDNTFNISNPDKVKIVNEEIKVLKEKYADILSEVEKLNEEWKVYAVQSQELNLMAIHESNIPDNIDIHDLTILMELNLVTMES
jgi:hypothetical protein